MRKASKKSSKSGTITKPDDYFKAIVQSCKDDLPPDWKERVLKKFPAINNPKGFTLLQNIYHLKSAANVEVILYMADLAGYVQRKGDAA